MSLPTSLSLSLSRGLSLTLQGQLNSNIELHPLATLLACTLGSQKRYKSHWNAIYMKSKKKQRLGKVDVAGNQGLRIIIIIIIIIIVIGLAVFRARLAFVPLLLLVVERERSAIRS